MKALLLSILMAVSFTTYASDRVGTQDDVISKKGGKRSEPAPKDKDERRGGNETPDRREETYEGRGRGEGGAFDGGGYDGGSGGMISEVFFVPGKITQPITRHLKTEDRGDVIVYTLTEQADVSAEESCTIITTTVVEKRTRKVISSNREEFCNHLSL